MNEEQQFQGYPVTVVVSRVVKPDCIPAFEEWVSGITHESSTFDGYLGSDVVRPHDPSNPTYITIFKFDTYPHLRAWADSPNRARWVEKVRPMTVGEADVKKITGLEYWFTLPDRAAVMPPPRHKMALVTLLAIYPLILLVDFVLGPLTDGMPYLLGLLLSVGATVILMTWPVMPMMTRLFAFWLFPFPRKPKS
jgi:hypothetical protein